MDAITIQESARLVELETVIESGKQTFVSVGLALAEIQASRLYRVDHSDFDSYCREKWGWGKSYAHSLIDSARTVSALPPSLSAIVDTESQARELSKVEPEKREEVVKKAASKGKVTAKAIKEAATPAQSTEVVRSDALEEMDVALADLDFLRDSMSENPGADVIEEVAGELKKAAAKLLALAKRMRSESK